MNHFEPSVARARHCRKEMDGALWASVQAIIPDRDRKGQSGGDRPLARPASPERARAETYPSAARPTDLLDYGAYFDLSLVPAFGSEVPEYAKAAAVGELARRLVHIDGSGDTTVFPRISNFSSDTYAPEHLDRMRRWWDMEPANRMAMTGASDEEVVRSRRLIGIALDHLHDASAELCEEVRTIVRDIVLSRPDGSNRINYGGATSFALWGAFTINVETHLEWIQFYRQIVHEAAHNLLFGMARDEPLVRDDASVRVQSPIRADPRPLDGVYHAAFVSAREALAIDLLLCRHEAVGCLENDDPKVLEDLLGISVLAFWDCIETLRRDAQLTDLGADILADCEKYMVENFALESS